MVRHIVIWDYNEKFSEQENHENGVKIKTGLEGLVGQIEGIIELKVAINPLDSSNGDVVLNALFSDVEAFKLYQTHPKHLKVAAFVASSTQNRRAIDYIE